MLVAAIGLAAIPAFQADAATPPQGVGAPAASMTPTSPSDVYVQGRYGRNGVYVPPHYMPKQKPAFSAFNRRDTSKHGYFDLKKPDQTPR